MRRSACPAKFCTAPKRAWLEYAGGIRYPATPGWPFLSGPQPPIGASGHFSLHLSPKLAHPANRHRQPSLRRSKPILLISEPADEAARFCPNERSPAQASDDLPNIQLIHCGEFPSPEVVIRVVPGAVVPSAQGNGAPIR